MLASVDQPAQPIALPLPRSPVTVRVATLDDLAFVDDLQKQQTKQVGFMPTKSLEAKLNAEQVLIAEQRSEVRDQKSEGAMSGSSLTSDLRPLTSVPVGYAIGTDRYFKHDDIGIIYQLNVVPGKRRALVGASLVRAMFDRAAYGCRLFCCWCAQDIEANFFWESIGFIPLAFRTGSRGRGQKSEVRDQPKARVHIFWQRRIRAGDSTTPYWFPSQTSGGTIREDRLVLPIPPGTHWSDVMPVVLPSARPEISDQRSEVRRRRSQARHQRSALTSDRRPLTSIATGGLRFAVPKEAASDPKPKREPKQKVKNDPKLVAAARELRDRWLEQVNADASTLPSQAKYDVRRQLEAPPTTTTAAVASAVPALPEPLAA